MNDIWGATKMEWNEIYGFTDLDGSQPDARRYNIEVEEPGKPADVTGYR